MTNTNSANSYSTVTGTFQNMESNCLTYIYIDDNGSIIKLVWLSEFTGADKLMTPHMLENRKVEVTYVNKKVYLPEKKEYVILKEITSLNIL